ncbi:MAG: bifunctional hydroxymethylpyrimidine kinase/phosphomethylpyrimidine kinase [Candidatus Moduliflexus flocculans]|nr:bifunctional hydroxymethylpyrimidine kinase/phosphomethylpyrimidine kinase [Candidatus Moduliflexus flocculans]
MVKSPRRHEEDPRLRRRLRPLGGAGVLLDIAVFESLGHRGFGVLTAVTAQTPARVDRVHPLAPGAVAGQFERLAGADRHRGRQDRHAGHGREPLRGRRPAGRTAGRAPGRRPDPALDLGRAPPRAAGLAALPRGPPGQGRARHAEPRRGLGSSSGRRVRTVAGDEGRGEGDRPGGTHGLPGQGRASRGPGRRRPLRRAGRSRSSSIARHDVGSVHGTGCYLSSVLVALPGRGPAARRRPAGWPSR